LSVGSFTPVLPIRISVETALGEALADGEPTDLAVAAGVVAAVPPVGAAPPAAFVATAAVGAVPPLDAVVGATVAVGGRVLPHAARRVAPPAPPRRRSAVRRDMRRDDDWCASDVMAILSSFTRFP